MHIEILVEDSSGASLLEHLLPKIVGTFADPHTWKIHRYKGIGRIPEGMSSNQDAAKRQLLTQLPRILGGYGKTPGIDAVVVVVDSDRRNCVDFLNELKEVLQRCNPKPNAIFRIAIEEVEAWYFGDRRAVIAGYPRAKASAIDSYTQDSVCGTWEKFADAVYPGGSAALKKVGWPAAGNAKHEWADTIGPAMSIDENNSPSFQKLVSGFRRLLAV